MPHYSVWTYALFAFGASIQLTLLILMVRHSHLRRWPSVFCMVAVELCSGLIQIAISGRSSLYPAYFYCYWVTAVAVTLGRTWVISDVARSFEGLGFLPRQLYWLIGTFSAGVGFFCALYAFRTSGLQASLSVILLYGRAVDFGWVAFAAALLICTKLLNFAWNPLGARIASGMIFELAAGASSSYFTDWGHAVRHAVSVLNIICCIGVLIYWITAFLTLPDRSIQSDVLEQTIVPVPYS